ncbi:MAG: T9SS type A sorting domain-containing protein [Bacteroidetes bacterium]|nr:T9SS type A sorting domain-containing protein [Bacteroidota bacterium]
MVATDTGVADASTDRSNWNTSLRIGRPGNSSRYFNGIIDEVRILSLAISENQIATQFSNQDSPTTFVTVSPEVFVLPVELVSFEAKFVEDNKVKLTWETASEKDHQFFTVECSQNAAEWEKILSIQGLGSTTGGKHYEEWHDHPYQGVSYYRLKQTDLNGSFSYSHTEVLNIKPSLDLEIFPNPANNTLVFTGMDLEETIITVTNIIGQKVHTIKMNGAGRYLYDSSLLPEGIYFIVVSNQGRIYSDKVMIVRDN